jgi:hypothetical protein
MTATEYNIRLKIPSQEAVLCKLDCVSLEDRTILVVRGQNGLYIELLGLSEIIYPLLLKFARIANPRANYSQRIEQLTPQQVVAYFEASPVLSGMADDVRAAVLPAGSEKVSQVEIDLAKVAHLVEPSLADIAEALTGERTYAGAKYARVKAVHKALKTTTTTEQGANDELLLAA